LERDHEEWITQAAAAGIGTIIRGGVARGEPGAGLGSEDRWRKWGATGLDELRGPGESPTTFLLRYALSHPRVDTTIVATLHPEHLKKNILAAERGPMPPDAYAETKRRLAVAGAVPSAVNK
jgi:aryl-alcohol dehydrogenase-like predicted oxidoreductase